MALQAKATLKEAAWSQHPHKNWTLLVLSGTKPHPSLLPTPLCIPPDLLRISITLDPHLQREQGADLLVNESSLTTHPFFPLAWEGPEAFLGPGIPTRSGRSGLSGAVTAAFLCRSEATFPPAHIPLHLLGLQAAFEADRQTAPSHGNLPLPLSP